MQALGVFLLSMAPMFLIGWLREPNLTAAISCASLGVVMSLISVRLKRTSPLDVFFLLTATGSISFLLWQLVPKLSSYLHLLGQWSVRLVVFVYSLLGVNASYGQGVVYLPLENGVRPVAVTSEALGVLPIVIFVLSWYLANLIATRSRWPSAEFVVGVAVAFAFARFSLVVLVSHFYRMPDLLWNPYFLLLSLAPFAIILSARIMMGEKLPRPQYRPKHGQALVGVALLSFLLLVVSIRVPYIGAETGPHRILIDDSHSEWEWSTIPYDTEYYGKKSNYNYYSLRRWLECFYEVDVLTAQSGFDAVELSRYDIVLIKTPTRRYETAEIEAVRDYVLSGGGLWVLGDHTNFLGMSSYLNQLLSRLGSIQFRHDATYDLTTSRFDLLKNPGTAGLLQGVLQVQFLTASSLRASLLADYLIVSGDLGSDYADYSNPGFFGEMTQTPENHFGFFASCVGERLGRGAVLVFSDSTILSNFSVHYPGHAQLVYNMTQYLLSPSWYSTCRAVAIWVSLIAFLISFLLLVGSQRRRLVISVLILGLLFLKLGAVAADTLTATSVFDVVPKGESVVAFAQDVSDFVLPAYKRSNIDRPELAYDTFFLCVQRLEMIPTVAKTVATATEWADSIVIVSPDWEALLSQCEVLRSYVGDGGTVLILETDPQTDANALLSTILGPNVPYTRIPDQSAFWARLGSGQIIVSFDDYSRESLGYLDDVPNDQTWPIYKRAFSLLEMLDGPQ